MFLLFKKNKFIFISLFIIIIFSLLFVLSNSIPQNLDIFMGSSLYITCNSQDLELEKKYDISLEKYFRPSSQEALNTRFVDIPYEETNNYLKYAEKVSPMLSSPENVVLNYYSVLREASNVIKGNGAGCGTIGVAKSSYPIAYNFFTKEYMKKNNYNNYVASFKNILHTSLIKMYPIYINENEVKYFIELETIEGTKDMSGAFKYYYGYIYVKKENDLFKISNIELYNEVYLCAPYHRLEL